MEFTYQGKTYPIVIVLKNNKRSYYRLKQGKIIITTSVHANLQELLEFLVKNADKIIIEKNKTNFFFREFDPTTKIFGVDYPVEYQLSHKNKIIWNDGKLLFEYKQASSQIFVMEAFRKELVLTKMKEIIEREPYLQVRYPELSLFELKSQRMKSLFGSCHKQKKIIKLNSLLSYFDETYLRSVFLHEIVHIHFVGHQSDFYQELLMLDPDYLNNHRLLKTIYLSYEVS